MWQPENITLTFLSGVEMEVVAKNKLRLRQQQGADRELGRPLLLGQIVLQLLI